MSSSVGAERAKNPDDARRAVFEQDDIEDDGAGCTARAGRRGFTTRTACGGVTPGPTSDTMSLAICALIDSLRSVKAISISTSIGDGRAAAGARTEAPLAQRDERVLIESEPESACVTRASLHAAVRDRCVPARGRRLRRRARRASSE